MDPGIGPIFLAVGVVSLLLAGFFYWRNRRFMKESVATQGIVTGLATSSSSEGGLTYHPIVQFTTQDGQTIQFQESVGSSPPRFQPGQTTTVRYLPSNPHRAKIPGWFGSWFLPSFFLLFTLTFGGVGAWQLLSGSGSADGGEAVVPSTQGSGVVASVIPGGDPAVSGPTVVVQDGSGTPRTTVATCDSIRDSGDGREVRLGLDVGPFVFAATPYTGPGAYQPGVNLEVSSDLFSRQELRSLTGAVIFEASGRSGVLNLVSGSKSISGAWDCTLLPKP